MRGATSRLDALAHQAIEPFALFRRQRVVERSLKQGLEIGTESHSSSFLPAEQLLAEALPRGIQTGLHGSLGNGQGVGDFAVRLPDEMPQDDDRAVLWRELLEGGFDLHAPLLGQRRLERIAAAGDLGRQRLLRTAAADDVEALVDEDAVHPAEEPVARRRTSTAADTP